MFATVQDQVKTMALPVMADLVHSACRMETIPADTAETSLVIVPLSFRSVLCVRCYVNAGCGRRMLCLHTDTAQRMDKV